MTDRELIEAINAARQKAAKVGSMHAMWDVIFDAEAILCGKPATLSRVQVEKKLSEFIMQTPWDGLDPNNYQTRCARCSACVVGKFGPNGETNTPCPECGAIEYTGGFESPAGALDLKNK